MRHSCGFTSQAQLCDVVVHMTLREVVLGEIRRQEHPGL